ncbi:hypothetical protein NE237_026110 [Protea cynaroides]|uniref:Uncharacterized protein n=1 Tax=Protea cynaroides TaxID=273540 RepID=A0A9Q0K068_9MAGN|nr:hypothetical protein NE237_026110 [Protea cynaroides]
MRSVNNNSVETVNAAASAIAAAESRVQQTTVQFQRPFRAKRGNGKSGMLWSVDTTAGVRSIPGSFFSPCSSSSIVHKLSGGIGAERKTVENPKNVAMAFNCSLPAVSIRN